MTALDVLAQCAWKGSLLLAAGFLASAVLRPKSAALRHGVWTACFAALLVLPAAMAWMPGFPKVATVEVAAVSDVPVAHATQVPTDGIKRSSVPLVFPTLLVWAGGAAIVAFWFLAGMVRTSRMVRRGVGAKQATAVARSLGLDERVRVVMSEDAPMPLMWGVLRPVIVLPVTAGEWTESQLRTVLLHELVHVKRRDLVAQAIGQAACCFYWMNPLVWIAARQLRKEREQACDDVVLARGVPAPEYAGLLVDLVRSVAARRNAWRQAPAMAEASGLEARVRALLDTRRDRRPLNKWKGAAVGLAGLIFLLPLVAHQEAVLVSKPAVVVSQGALAPVVAIETAVPVRPRPRKLAMAVAAVAAPAPVPQSGSISGTVRDPSGAVVPNCEVRVSSSDGANKQTMVTDNVGAYHFDSLTDGRYTLEVGAPGFKMVKLAALAVTGGNTSQVNVNLTLGEVTETVQVTGHKPSSGTAPQAAPVQRIFVGGNVQMSKLVRQPRPAYPPELQQLGVEGTVQLQAVISKDGVPINLKVINNGVDQRLVPLALDAVQEWRYSPTLLNGQPVETITSIDVSFKLN